MNDQRQSMRRVPNLFVVGVQKCGTTLLCNYLEKHPKIVHSQPKEPFALQKKMTPEMFERYLQEKFPNTWERQDIQYVADGSTTYFQSPVALQNIEKYCGRDVKIIVALRHPVHRAISHFFHDIKRNRGDIRNSIIDKYYISKSTYAPHLSKWKSWCGKDNLKVIRYSDLRKDPSLFINPVFEFLGIDPIPIQHRIQVNVGWKIFRSGDVIRASESRDHVIPMSDIQDLHDFLLNDIVETGRLTGWDMSDWLKPIPFSYWKEEL